MSQERTLKRQKARNDNKSRIGQAQLERHETMNEKAPAAAAVAEQAEMEIKRFSAAEIEELQERMQKYQESANFVNKWLAFLKKQYSVGDNEGWQLGEGRFVRPVKAVEPAPAATAQPGKKPKGGSKKKAATIDLPPLGQGESAATVAQNGQLATEPVL